MILMSFSSKFIGVLYMYQ